MANDRINQSLDHSDRDDFYPRDERPYRVSDFMGDAYYRNPPSVSAARTAEDAREYFEGETARLENNGRHYARPRNSGWRTLERGR